jgi:hypothetical protein
VEEVAVAAGAEVAVAVVVTVAGADELVRPDLIGAGPKGGGGRHIGREGHRRSSLLSLPAQNFPRPASVLARGERWLIDSVALGKKGWICFGPMDHVWTADA